MTADEELKAILVLPRSEFDYWYKQRVFVADSMPTRAGIEPEEIVNETIWRVLSVHNERYCWDGKNPDSFSKFFNRSMKTTTSSFDAKGRSERRGRKRLEDQGVFLTSYEAFQHAALEADCKTRSLATAIAKTKMRGATRKYVDRLPGYVRHGANTREIALDLNIREGSVASIRSRLLTWIGDDVEKG